IILSVLPFFFHLEKLFSKNFICGFEFWCIGILSSAMIFHEVKKGRRYSISMICSFFVYIFVFIAGGYEYLKNKFSYNIVASDSEIAFSNLLILLWQILFFISPIFTRNTRIILNFDRKSNLTISASSKKILIILCFIIGLIYVAINGVGVLFNRTYNNENFAASTQALTSILKILKNGLGMWTLYICAIDYKKNHTSSLYVLFSFMACIILIPPLATARTFVLITYGGFFLIMSKRLKKGMNFFLLILFLDLFAAPVFNLFRNGFSGDKALLFNTLSDFKDSFLKSDYDAYTMFLGSVKYVSNYDITYGLQLLSAILFFVPRSLWKNKAIGSGATVMAALKTANVSNISCPIFAEAYINFGLVGIVIFSLFLGNIVYKIDYAYWNSSDESFSAIKSIYPFFTLFILIVFRGDLLNAYSWTIGYILDLLVIIKLFMKKKQQMINNEAQSSDMII
ncbi:hypothetical protein RASY3_02440, partial [Ruminococcus albus SY3]